MIMTLKYKLKQYGYIGSLTRCCKYILRKMGVFYESYCYFSSIVNKETLINVFNNSVNVRHLSYNDFLLGDKDYFTNKKLQLIKDRLQNDNYIPYGIINNKKLIYSYWLLTKGSTIISPHINYHLRNDEFLLLDAYCTPSARGNGLHATVSAYLCLEANQMGKTKGIVIVVKGNIPAQKVQLKCGLNMIFDYYVLTIFGKTFTNFYRQKLKHDC